MSEPVSVIICTHELTPELGNLLTDILNQDYPEFEVILVNDGPDDNVSALLNTLIPNHDNLRIIPFDASKKQTGGKKEPLAAGIAQAKYGWLLMTDSDCTVQKEWIQSMMNCASRKKPIVLGYGPLAPGPGIVNAISVFDTTMIAVQYMSFALKGWPYMGVGRNLLYHRSLYDAVDGFQSHIDLASGDDDLFVQSVVNRANVSVNLDSKSFVFSSAKESWQTLFAQKRRHVSTSSRYKWRLKTRIGLVGLSFIFAWLGGILMITTFSAVPIGIFVIGSGVQWAVFASITRRLNSDGEHGAGIMRFIPLYPLWAVLYALFLARIGTLAIFGKSPATWD